VKRCLSDFAARGCDQAIHKAVKGHGAACFAQCEPSPPTNVTDCWMLCFYQTLLGRQPLPPFARIAGAEPMAAAQLVGPFLNVVKPEGEGGCPDTIFERKQHFRE
jgi:hypothetical protein